MVYFHPLHFDHNDFLYHFEQHTVASRGKVTFTLGTFSMVTWALLVFGLLGRDLKRECLLTWMQPVVAHDEESKSFMLRCLLTGL